MSKPLTLTTKMSAADFLKLVENRLNEVEARMDEWTGEINSMDVADDKTLACLNIEKQRLHNMRSADICNSVVAGIEYNINYALEPRSIPECLAHSQRKLRMMYENMAKCINLKIDAAKKAQLVLHECDKVKNNTEKVDRAHTKCTIVDFVTDLRELNAPDDITIRIFTAQKFNRLRKMDYKFDNSDMCITVYMKSGSVHVFDMEQLEWKFEEVYAFISNYNEKIERIVVVRDSSNE